MKQYIVTGGASGIGLAIVKRFVVAGCRVVVLDSCSDPDDLWEAVDKDVVDFIRCDVSDYGRIHACVSEIAGPISGLINNAGVASIGNIEATTEADFDRLFRINVKGIYNVCSAVIPRLREAGGGSIVNMASIVSVVGIADRFAYSMSKGAVLSMTMSIARDYVAENIRCNAVSPARVHTPFVDGFLAENYPGREQEMFSELAKSQPLGRMGTPDEVAAMVQYLCSDDATFITGSNFSIDGGFTNLKM